MAAGRAPIRYRVLTGWEPSIEAEGLDWAQAREMLLKAIAAFIQGEFNDSIGCQCCREDSTDAYARLSKLAPYPDGFEAEIDGKLYRIEREPA